MNNDLSYERIANDMKRLDQIEAKARSDEFLARLFNMGWLIPKRRGKHSNGTKRSAKWRAKRDKKRRIAELSRARNARKGK